MITGKRLKLVDFGNVYRRISVFVFIVGSRNGESP
jgi:hypothetical protein